ncbi:MAG: hypothetical protein R2910_12920 [Gemmatimonadales bacterium]
MSAFRLTRLRLLHLAVLLPVAIASCSSDDANGPTPAPGAALHTSWNVTAFATAADDFIAQGMVLVITYKSDGTYTLTVTNDLVGICNPGPNCVEGGDYTATATAVTLDPGTVDEVVFDYTIAGTTLTMNGDIGGTPVTITATKA